MRRFFLIAALLTLAVPVFWKQIGTGLLKTGAWFQGYQLDFSDLHVGIRHIVLEDVFLCDRKKEGSTFAFRAERLVVTWPLAFKAEQPFVSLSKQIAWPKESSWNAVIDMSEGHLNWLDGTFPPCRFALYRNEEGQSAFRIEREVRDQAIGGRLDVQWIGNRIEELDLHAEGIDVAYEQAGFKGQGSFELDWQARDWTFSEDWNWREILEATQRCKLSIEQGAVTNGSATIRDIHSVATYQLGLGGKCEGWGKAETGTVSLPLSFEAKAWLKEMGEQWFQADFALGTTVGTILDQPWSVHWQKLGSQEVQFLQQFASVLTDWNWIQGTADGAVSWSGSPSLEQLELKDLTIERGSFSFGCKEARYQQSGELQGGWLAHEGKRRAIDWKGTWDGDHRALYLSGKIDELDAQIGLLQKGEIWSAELGLGSLLWMNSSLRYLDRSLQFLSFNGDIRGVSFTGFGRCLLNSESELQFNYSIPEFRGAISPWHAQFLSNLPVQGDIRSIESGIYLEGLWDGALELTSWSVACGLEKGHLPVSSFIDLHGISLQIHADSMGWDFAPVRGISRFTMANRAIEIPFEAPRIHIENDRTQFDIRCQRKTWDFIRFAGEKQGTRIAFDPARCQVLGEPVVLSDWEYTQEGLTCAAIETKLSLPLLRSLVAEWGWSADLPLQGSLQVNGMYERGKIARCFLSGLDTCWGELPFPIDFKIEEEKAALSVGPFAATGKISLDESLIRIREGEGTLHGARFSFDGKLTPALKGEFTLQRCKADLEEAALRVTGLSGWKGSVEGQGYVCLSLEGLEADLDLQPTQIEWQGYAFQNNGPLQLFVSSSQGAIVKGLDGSVTKEGLLIQGKADLCQFDRQRRHWTLQKTHLYLPADLLAKTAFPLANFFDPGKEVDLIAEIDCASDGSSFACEIKEGLFPIAGAVRHVRDLHLFLNPRSCIGDCLLSHQGKVAKISLDVDIEPELSGRCLFEDVEKPEDAPLAIDWTYETDRLSIQAIDGSFAGIEASFHGQSIDTASQLIGSARVDFAELSRWVPREVAEVFEEIKMGKGYELKGHLSIDRTHWHDIHFKGIFSGKQIELFGYQLRTLLGQAELSGTTIHLYDLKISDSAGSLKIDDLMIQTKNKEPWTIAIPKLVIQDLRPSLLHGPDEEPGPLSPLLVRKLTITDFKGLLDDGKTYTAKGDLTFLNSFKRGETVLDFPSNIFGRIVGLDVDLLIPVIGDLTFQLKDGYFTLNELKESYSEGKRSEFFLEKTATSPRMDLKGNLQILVKMKQFVLFKFTDAFMISIEGKLNDPQFRLQKKRRLFSSLGYD